MKKIWKSLKQWFRDMKAPPGYVTRETMLEQIQDFRDQIAEQDAELDKMGKDIRKEGQEIQKSNEITMKIAKLRKEFKNLSPSEPAYKEKAQALLNEIKQLNKSR